MTSPPSSTSLSLKDNPLTPEQDTNGDGPVKVYRHSFKNTPNFAFIPANSGRPTSLTVTLTPEVESESVPEDASMSEDDPEKEGWFG